jgi:hypothetical protein
MADKIAPPVKQTTLSNNTNTTAIEMSCPVFKPAKKEIRIGEIKSSKISKASINSASAPASRLFSSKSFTVMEELEA